MNLRYAAVLSREKEKAKVGEPKVWFTSAESFPRTLLSENRRLLTTILVAVFVCAAGSIAAAESKGKMHQAVGGFQLRTGVIVDAGRGVVFVMNHNRGIDADDLSSGRVLWSTTIAAKPLLEFDDRLVAQAEAHSAGVLPIVVLNSRTGGEPIFEADVPLPAGLSAFIDDRLGAQFSVTARTEPAALFVSWRSTQTAISGVYRPGPPQTRESRGAARIDLKTGQADSLKSNERVKSRGQWPATVQHLLKSGAVRVPPWRAGSLILAAESRGNRMVLERWDGDSGQALSSIELAPGFSVAFASGDDRLILTRKAIGADPSTGWQNYEWAIYSLETGQQVAKIRMVISAAPFFIWHSILVYESRPYGRRINGAWTEEPLELRAVDLKTGAESWKIRLRDTVYRGPPPPQP
jgi:hypothetical protein